MLSLHVQWLIPSIRGGYVAMPRAWSSVLALEACVMSSWATRVSGPRICYCLLAVSEHRDGFLAWALLQRQHRRLSSTRFSAASTRTACADATQMQTTYVAPGSIRVPSCSLSLRITDYRGIQILTLAFSPDGASPTNAETRSLPSRDICRTANSNLGGICEYVSSKQVSLGRVGAASEK